VRRRGSHIFSRQLAHRDDSEVVSRTRRQPFTSGNIPNTHFCQSLSRPQGHSAAGKIRSIEKSNDLIGNRNRDLPACSIVPQQTTLPRFPPCEMYWGLFPWGVKRSKRETYHSSPSSVEVKNLLSYTSTAPIRLHITAENCNFTFYNKSVAIPTDN
jgi:hypothetical protein